MERTFWKSSSKRRCWNGCKTLPAAFASAIIESTSAVVKPNGFSQRTCFPPFNAMRATGACIELNVETMTISTFGSAINASAEAYGFAFGNASCERRSGMKSAIATTSNISRMSFIALA